MAGDLLASLTAPVSADAPCGQDLDLEGDPDYLNFMAKAEGLLPASYFSVQDGRPFDRGNIDFPAELEAAKPLLERTRDLRLLVLLAKFHILNRDLAAFVTYIDAVSILMDTRWDDVHPRGEAGEYTMRMAAIETLDDLPTVVYPLQFVPLVNHRRVGPVTYRSYLAATGEVKPREDEDQPLDLGTIERALMEAELPPLVDILHHFEALQTSYSRIRTTWIERAGFEQAVNLEKATQTIGRILSLVNGIVAKRDPAAAIESAAEPAESSAAEDRAAAPAEIAAGQIASRAEAAEALAAVADYFARMEPSNPSLLLARQAHQLIGLTFVEAMRVLVPAFVEQAAVKIGAQYVFDLPIERLSALAAPAETASDYLNAGDSIAGELALDDSAGSEQLPDRVDGGPGDGMTTPGCGGTPKSVQRVNSRQQAFALLDRVASYYRAAEPSSPIAVIVERARHLADRDFMSLLKDFLPEATLRSTTGE